MIRVLVNGAHGRMGQEAVKAIQTDPALKLVGQAGHGDNLGAMIRDSKAQVVVDFTIASDAFEMAQQIIEAGVHPVIGTSGFSPEQIATLQQQCADKELGGIIAPNFSLGAILMMRYAKDAARYFPKVEITEKHHDNKKDAPSGTAIKTAQMIKNITGTETSIHSVRLPGIVAEQEVLFGGQGETLSIYHRSIDRASFMPGVLLACKRVISLDKLIYGLEEII